MIFPFLLIVIVWYLFFSPYSQFFGRVLWKFPTKQKKIALTFDDGPNEPYTSQLLDILKSHNIKASFFLVGENAQRHPEVVRRIAQEGHTIGNHSTHHLFRNYFRDSSFMQEIQTTQTILEEITGLQPKFYRSPWLFRTPALLQTVNKLHLQPIWGVFGSAIEIFQPRAETIARHALKKVRPGSILIFHDGYNNKGGKRAETLAAIHILIPQLQKEGYSFVAIDSIKK